MLSPTQPAAQRLRELRERSGLSDCTVAFRLGYTKARQYRVYEDPTIWEAPYLQSDLVRRLLPILTGRGDPPITREEVASLAAPVKTLDDIMDECDQFWQSAELRPGQALLKLNRVVTVDQFLRIMTVLSETEADDR